MDAKDKMSEVSDSPVIAAVDLGSNSFHLTLAQLQHNNLQIIGRLKEKVRLAEGLLEDGTLSEEAQDRALACLEQFRHRLQGMPAINVRAVGTFTLRKASNAAPFLKKAQQALGYPIEIISGREEARLIYEGVAHFQISNLKQLIVDIGGGSTEFAIGEAFEPTLLDSLQMGCVSFTQKYFTDGLLNKRNFKRAITAARLELFSIQDLYLRESWEATVGTSGTIESILEIKKFQNPLAKEITLSDLEQLKNILIEQGNIESIFIEGLSDARREILPAGLAILIAVFKALRIESMSTSPAALREGMLYELTGIEKPLDIKERAIKGLLSRYHVDFDQARRVNQTALTLWQQIAPQWNLQNDYFKQMLSWASRCHEIGLSINFSKQQKHGEHLLIHTDISGFSIFQQQVLALLVRCFRRKFPIHRFEVFDDANFRIQLIRLARILRLAVLLNHRRRDTQWQNFKVLIENEQMTLKFAPEFLEHHSLLAADLEQEKLFLADAGIELHFY